MSTSKKYTDDFVGSARVGSRQHISCACTFEGWSHASECTMHHEKQMLKNVLGFYFSYSYHKVNDHRHCIVLIYEQNFQGFQCIWRRFSPRNFQYFYYRKKKGNPIRAGFVAGNYRCILPVTYISRSFQILRNRHLVEEDRGKHGYLIFLIPLLRCRYPCCPCSPWCCAVEPDRRRSGGAPAVVDPLDRRPSRRPFRTVPLTVL